MSRYVSMGAMPPLAITTHIQQADAAQRAAAQKAAAEAGKKWRDTTAKKTTMPVIKAQATNLRPLVPAESVEEEMGPPLPPGWSDQSAAATLDTGIPTPVKVIGGVAVVGLLGILFMRRKRK